VTPRARVHNLGRPLATPGDRTLLSPPTVSRDVSEPSEDQGFSLSLEDVEEEMEGEGVIGDVVLGVLDGTTDSEEWIRNVEYGNVLVLDIEGDLNELAQGIAPAVAEMGGGLTHFRGFLVVSPPGVEIDTDRLG
jgi:hypothetical protein